MTEAGLPVALQGGQAHGPPGSGIPWAGVRAVGADLPRLQGGEPVDQPAVGLPAGGCRDVLVVEPGDEGLEVGAPLRELGGWTALQVPEGWRGCCAA